MHPTDLPTTITAHRSQGLSKSYPTHLFTTLKPLDTFRQHTLPKTIHARTPPHITHPELRDLVAWKLSRGKFRPTLTSLVASNTPAAVLDASTRAFAAYGAADGTARDGAERAAARDAALKHLTSLRGVGPATAALVLSVYDPAGVAFFSDELFAWLATAGGDEDAEVKVWQGKMAYNVKEYRLLCERVEAVLERLRGEGEEGGGIRALDVEHAAWMIVKGLGDTEGAVEDGVAASSKARSRESKASGQRAGAAATTKKRSAASSKQAPQPSKRSRRK